MSKDNRDNEKNETENMTENMTENKDIIESLTPEQEAKIPEYVKMGIDIGFSTTRMNREKAKAYVKKLYKFMGRKNTDPEIIFAEGPMEAWGKIEEIYGEKIEFVWPYLDGQFWSCYYAWINFYRDVVRLQIDIDTSIIEEMIEFGNIYPLENHCIMAEKIETCQYDPSFGLHCEGSHAMSYRDGTKIWALHGVIVPQWLAETPHDKLNPKDFATIENVEVRREFVRKVGVERICNELGSKILDKSPDGTYELHEIDLGGKTGKWPYLKMLNPSIGVYHMECVEKTCKTIKDAITFRNKSDADPIMLT